MTVDLFLGIAALLLLAGSALDLAARKVPNRLCLALGIDGIGLQAAAHALPSSMLAMMAVFVPALVCWRHGIMGGGDVKLIAAATLLVRPAAVPMLVLAIALAGGLLGLAYWTMTHMLHAPVSCRPTLLIPRILRVERYRIARGFPLPYAVAITGGTLFALAQGLAP